VPRAQETPDRDPLAWLLATSHTLAPADLGAAVARALRAHGVSDAGLYLVDHDQLRLHPLPPVPDGTDPIDLAGSTAGRAFTWETTHTEATAGGAVHVWAPLVDGTARLGVLRAEMPQAADDDTLETIERIAALAAELIVAKGQYTDAFEIVRRHRPMSLAAELQRSSLPPVALVTDEVAVAGLLQPAYEVAGDSFDYSLNPDGLHVAILDSVGHDLDSSLISHLVQGSLRNSRRHGRDLLDAYAHADEALADMYPDQRFATAAFGTLDLDSGLFCWISAGHPPPLLIRGGQVEGEAEVVPTVPIGLRHRRPPVVNEVELAPGDALLLYTDGVTEGGARGGERFGLERFVEVLEGVLIEGLPPAEVLRRLIVAVLEHTAYELHDDAGVVLVQRRIPGEP
jgi:serine phosphatase RsbU (regulator of sigma subunit)